MKNTRIKYSCTCFFIVIALFASTICANAATGRQLAQNAIAALQSQPNTTTSIIKNVAGLSWSWFEVKFYDEQYPLTVDIVGSNFTSAQKVIYLLPGGSYNFSSVFFTPMDKNLAQFFREAGYLVVGITPREDNVPSGVSYYDFMADWGMDKHKADIQKIIGIIQAKINLQYWVLGHSFGAAYALDYASTCSDSLFKKVIALDIYSFNGNEDADGSYQYFSKLIAKGQYADFTYEDDKSLTLNSILLPYVDSGVARPVGGDFTFLGLSYYSVICSKQMLAYKITDWPLVKSYVAGVYQFSCIPLLDKFSFTYSDTLILADSFLKLGSGLLPCAVYRDYYDVNGYNINYHINWSNIQVPVLWVNTELGFGNKVYIGPQGMTFKVIPGYGHLDILLSSTAKKDVWHYFLE
jgi:pimeloyl-ACP methyl ester carboxylesterase